jgi:hypothetical protein
VAQYCNRVEAEITPYSVEVVDLGLDIDGFGKHAPGRLPTPSLIIIDQAKCARQSIKLRQQIVVVEIRSAVQDDKRGSVADFPKIEFRP